MFRGGLLISADHLQHGHPTVLRTGQQRARWKNVLWSVRSRPHPSTCIVLHQTCCLADDADRSLCSLGARACSHYMLRNGTDSLRRDGWLQCAGAITVRHGRDTLQRRTLSDEEPTGELVRVGAAHSSTLLSLLLFCC
jgi:hypothetical protein